MAKNQYKCGSCYSFPITATIEFLYRRYLNISVKLSEQQLIDCTSENDTVNGCNSGNITKGFEYAMRVGLVDQDAYPYRSR
jgi:cathepsin L